ncbi:esterase AGAP003155 isoform X1 [Leptidea sinapis]|uniref:esterase AGAP003155 isoform X1 n=1 Tax=Leptidea sinapis TaxID=189913 RepID=UPI002138A42B|nr:esterase AGAP003155 isoform X1 [Leptidea sinapis]
MSEDKSNLAPENKKHRRPKMKILVFHGYRQNAKSYKAKIGAIRRTLVRSSQLIFLSAPHQVAREDDDSSDEDERSSCVDSEDNTFSGKCLGGPAKGFEETLEHQDERSWWFNSEDNTFSGKCLGGPAIGFEETLRLIEDTVKEHGPFDGLMGFSQGACLVGLLAAMQQKGYLSFSFKFVICISGFRSGSLVHKGFYDEGINLPSLHVFGNADSIVPKEMCEALINLFPNPAIVEHAGGHFVPCSGSIRIAYLDYLDDRHKAIYGTPSSK